VLLIATLAVGAIRSGRAQQVPCSALHRACPAPSS